MKFEEYLTEGSAPQQFAHGKGVKFQGKQLRRLYQTSYWYVWGNTEFDIREVRKELNAKPFENRKYDTYGEGETIAEKAKISDNHIKSMVSDLEKELKGKNLSDII